MPRPIELTSAGIAPLAAQNACGSTGSALTATGTNVGTALTLPFADNYFGTVSASTGCVFQTGELPGTEISVYNSNTGQTLTVYTPGTETFNNAATSFSVAVNKYVKFKKIQNGIWVSLLTA